ncbi:helix-turn-helix domain-containing protein, partial [Burkholderia cenocepacia]
LTPYGMLVRALRIVSGTTLMDMAEHLGRGPAELSAIEFGRKPVRDADIVDAAHFFACAGIQSTTHALTIAARAGGQHADQA